MIPTKTRRSFDETFKREAVTGGAEISMKSCRVGTFRTTCWDLVRAAKDPNSSEYQETWRRMVAIYHSPLYVFLRCQGRTPEDAEDLVQELFLRLSSKGNIARADKDRGKFRSFLVAALKNLNFDEYRRSSSRRKTMAQYVQAESHFLSDRAPGLTPEECFDRRCVVAFMDQALEMVRGTVVDKGRFDQLRGLIIQSDDSTVDQAATQCGISLSVATASLHRWRQQFRIFLRELVAESMASNSDDEISDSAVSAELRYLLTLMNRE